MLLKSKQTKKKKKCFILKYRVYLQMKLYVDLRKTRCMTCNIDIQGKCFTHEKNIYFFPTVLVVSPAEKSR